MKHLIKQTYYRNLILQYYYVFPGIGLLVLSSFSSI